MMRDHVAHYRKRNKHSKPVCYRFPHAVADEVDRLSIDLCMSKSQVLQHAVGVLAKEHPRKYPELPKE
jgi:hypothetical protein